MNQQPGKHLTFYIGPVVELEQIILRRSPRKYSFRGFGVKRCIAGTEYREDLLFLPDSVLSIQSSEGLTFEPPRGITGLL